MPSSITQTPDSSFILRNKPRKQSAEWSVITSLTFRYRCTVPTREDLGLVSWRGVFKDKGKQAFTKLVWYRGNYVQYLVNWDVNEWDELSTKLLSTGNELRYIDKRKSHCSPCSPTEHAEHMTCSVWSVAEHLEHALWCGLGSRAWR